MIHRWFKIQSNPHGETIWLTVYADLITNLALVFLALYGLTVMGKEAMGKAVQSMSFQNVVTQKYDLRFETLAPILREQLKETSSVTVMEETGVVRIEFGENVLFESGQAKLKTSAKKALEVVAPLLKSMPQTIVVEGHTDSVPLQKGSVYKDNWELSLARSMAMVNIFIDEMGFTPDHLATAAYGSYRPRASNESSSGRRLNRRVEIALFRDFPYELKKSGVASKDSNRE